MFCSKQYFYCVFLQTAMAEKNVSCAKADNFPKMMGCCLFSVVGCVCVVSVLLVCCCFFLVFMVLWFCCCVSGTVANVLKWLFLAVFLAYLPGFLLLFGFGGLEWGGAPSFIFGGGGGELCLLFWFLLVNKNAVFPAILFLGVMVVQNMFFVFCLWILIFCCVFGFLFLKVECFLCCPFVKRNTIDSLLASILCSFLFMFLVLSLVLILVGMSVPIKKETPKTRSKIVFGRVLKTALVLLKPLKSWLHLKNQKMTKHGHIWCVIYQIQVCCA